MPYAHSLAHHSIFDTVVSKFWNFDIKQNKWEWLAYLSRLLIGNCIFVGIPASSSKEQTINISTIPGHRQFLLINIKNFEFEGEGINWQFGFSSVSLQDGSKQSLREEETADPVGSRSCSHPSSQELNPVFKINKPSR